MKKKLLTLLSSLVFWRRPIKKDTPFVSYTAFPSDSLLIRIIETDTNLLNIALGISEERLKELGDTTQGFLDSQYEKAGIPGALEKISPLLKHPNEIVYVGIIIGSWYENQKRASIMSNIIKGFGGQKDH